MVSNNMKNVIDCFLYFNEEELLELRIKLLYDYVDKFVIVDSNTTHSGIKKEFTLNKVIDKLMLPRDKIEVIELDMVQVPPATEYEKHWDENFTESSRERLQRDAITKCLETNNFNDDTIFIISDCDEIINPNYIELYREYILKHRDKIFKVDLVQLEGRADMRAYYARNPDMPREWWRSMFICLKHNIENVSLTSIRSELLYKEKISYIYENGSIARDHGWHFSWMGSNYNRFKKSISFCHANNELEFLKYNNYSSDEMQEFLLNYNIKEGEISPGGDTNFIVKRYPIENLPSIIFDLPKVKTFLLP